MQAHSKSWIKATWYLLTRRVSITWKKIKISRDKVRRNLQGLRVKINKGT